jgi:NAD(P)-dependent dehydrogenase (short-subunit alcohol dehydrogenase family)
VYIRVTYFLQTLVEEVKGCKGKIHAVQGDVSKEEDVIRVVKWTREKLGGADVLVNNAGIFYTTPLTGDITGH